MSVFVVKSFIDAVKMQREINAKVNKALVKSLYESAHEVAAEAAILAPKDQGQLAGSIGVAVDPERYRFTVFSTSKHAIYMETGTRPGYGPNAGTARKAPLYLVGVGPNRGKIFKAVPELLGWVKRKLGLGGEEAEAAAKAMAFKIKYHGTKPHPFLGPALTKKEPRIRAIFERNIAAAGK